MDAREVVRFWFEDATPAQWFTKDPDFDETIRTRFAQIHAQAAAGECWMWRDTPEGRLGEILVLDQFSRNLYRDQAEAFACDGMGLVLAQEAVALGVDRQLTIRQRPFLYMPYMHSESLLIHDEAMRLFDQPGLEENLHFEKLHRDVIETYGRYPHRNVALGRANTPAEEQYLADPNAGF